MRLKKSLLAFDKVNELEYKRRFRSGGRSRRRRGVLNSLFIHGQTGWFTVIFFLILFIPPIPS